MNAQLPAVPVANQLAASPPVSDVPLRLVRVPCCLCGREESDPVAVGEDFEYRTSPDSFLAVRCRQCGLIYMDLRPDEEELPRIYPPSYHAFNFSPERFGFVFRIRRRLEARRALRWCRDLESNARILDVGCGDGFHLRLLREFGNPSWTLEGVDVNADAVAVGHKAGLTIHHGNLNSVDLPANSFDLVLLIQTIEHLADPVGTLAAVRELLRPGGRLVIVTDNADSLDFRLFGGRHWGGYHFPRHWNLFTRTTLRLLAEKSGLEVASLATQMSPVNWTYSVRNLLADWGFPRWLYNRFSLQSPLSLTAFTALDAVLNFVGRGALLNAVLRLPSAAQGAPKSGPFLQAQP